MQQDDDPNWAPAIGALALVLLLASLALVAAGGWSWFAKFLESAAPAWVQAVGSLIALGIAIWLPRRQRSLERSDARRKALSFTALLVSAARGADKVVQANSPARLQSLKHLVEQSARLGPLVPVDLLPTDKIAIFVALAAMAEEMKLAIADMEPRSTFGDGERQDFRARLESIEDLAAKLFNE
ncbi:hypothetical protein [Variovorax paradoxus]|uniref:hypothetical protein n=1 Tax=Variovorax paradoxus TaxID=34073 RepID=UPI0005A4EF55|nr:hypothetical protein [Variovorax paradoxus]